MSITIKTDREISLLREGGKRLARILKEISQSTKEGASPLVLDQHAESLILKRGGIPAFKGYRAEQSKTPFPAVLCFSINDEVVHGIPKKTLLQKGQLIKLDIGMQWPGHAQGLFTDAATTLYMGTPSPEIRTLIDVTREALMRGIACVRSGGYVGDISAAVQECLERNKIGIIKDLAGHGVGYMLHEDPLIPNYGTAGTGPELHEGMVLAVEVMTTLGNGEITLDRDGWTLKTTDGSMSAHFEHTVVVTKWGAEILTI